MTESYLELLGGDEANRLTKMRRMLARVRHGPIYPSRIFAYLMLLLIFLLVAVVPLLSQFDPYTQNLSNTFEPAFHSWSHLLGTDALGRDLLSRLSLATRISLLVVVAAVILNVVIGVTLGLAAGYLRGPVDSAIMGLADLVLAFPILILLVTVVGTLGPSALTVILTLGLAFWVSYARVSRAIALSLRKREFVLAAVTNGGSTFRILRKHLLPQLVPQLAIMASFDLGNLIVVESSLSYLGLGIQPPTPTLGGMIADGQTYLQNTPWLCVLPCVLLFVLVAGVQIVSRRFTSEGAEVRTSFIT